MRILVTGSRDWPYVDVVYAELMRLRLENAGPFTVVHGDCPQGADKHAREWAGVVSFDGIGVTHEPHPADWAKHGKAAGFIRNQEMVDLGADLCLAFVYNQSRGATDCLMRAAKARIPYRLIDLRTTDG